MAYLDINTLLVGGMGLAVLAIGSGMVAWEVAAFRADRPFFSTWYTRQMYWLTYFCAFLLGATMLLRAALWTVELLLSTQQLPNAQL
jgi:hypothetical protein